MTGCGGEAVLAEAWRKRRYQAALISKLSDSETAAAETQVWLEFAVKCGYLERTQAALIYEEYSRIIGILIGMMNHPETWVINKAD